MRLPRVLIAVSILVPLLWISVPPVTADVVHLRTGEAVKGRPVQEQSNEAYLTVEDYLTGALRRFDWSALDPEDRGRIRRDWGLEGTGDSTLAGEVFEIRLDDGSTTEIRGKVEREDEATVYLRKDGEILEVPKSRVVGRDEEELDVRDVYSAEQLMEQLYKDMRADENIDFDNPTANDHWQIASRAEWVGALEVAQEHYAACAADETYLKREVAEQRLANVMALLQDQAALDTLRDARMKLRMNLFRRTREILDGFPAKHPEASAGVNERLEDLRGEFNQRRMTQLQLMAGRRFVKIMQDVISDKVREKGVAITDVTGWTRRELPDQAFETLAGKAMGGLDDVTPEEAKSLWEGRPKRQWKRVTYGGGTFIVDPPKIKPPKRRRTSRSGGGAGKAGGGGQVDIPTPPTRDQWWEKAALREREQWVLAYVVERSELFELGEREYRPCPMCNGVGLLTKTLQTGDTMSYLCTRCGGAQQDVIVKYR